MGNNPSTNKSSGSASPLASSHESAKTPSSRRDPRNLIQNQRVAAAAEASLAQARGTTTATHRPRNSQSIPSAHFSHASPSSHSNSPSPRNTQLQMGSQQSKEEQKADVRAQPSKPVDVPVSAINTDSTSLRSHSQSIDPSGPPATQDMSYHLTRPPRLPLPIEEEVHTPGSPIIAPTDLDIDTPSLDVESLDNDTLPRRSSALSNTTIDEEDAEELRVDKTGATVPTTFEWHQKGDKVYVTGTIFQWNKKHRLHPVDGQPGLLRSTIHVRPGTHHIRFIVDGIMQCSPDLPTTVDFGNNLVNYIEVSADDLPRESHDVAVAQGAPVSSPDSQQPDAPAQTDTKAKAEEEQEARKPAPKTKPVLPPHRYTSQIPQYLVDLDKAEETSAYQYAAAAIEKLPSPPSLPGFLGKPILNAATPMKDDNSVLTMPNHTVLNHLATSSIKNNVLAVSATTRYKRKYVTTIMYKPTGDE
ncbi:SNF1 kinase subunit beta-3 [Hyphodiscus hymeniophilus]|uniref:SNF1 kinase subunit beta-3 n=1 Tax=Hyphodiscus hymeniophilus TaxID=353542 RepID=A0A9P6VIP5_9HELO|nr:SNF1 kinase subunit beta-3 [Hyphodiscus hymeniophilus]